MRQRLLLSLILFMLLAASAQSQEPTYWDDYADISWWGKAGNEKAYTITSAEELAGVAWLTNHRHLLFSDTTFILADDIDLSAHYWVPIGGEEASFFGNFDGNNKTIKGMKVGIDNTSAYTYAGFLGALGVKGNCLIENLTIEESSVQGASFATAYTGGIIAHVHSMADSKLEIRNCTSNITVSGVALTTHNQSIYNVGGIVGSFSGSGTLIIENCTNQGDITGGQAIHEGVSGTGGIIGYLRFNNSRVSGCVNEGIVTGGETNGASSRTGGIVGHAGGENRLTITGCSNKKEVLGRQASDSDGTYGSSSITGGIVGYVRSTASFVLKECQNDHTVKGGHAPYVETGGVAGSIEGYGFVSVFDNINTGTVEGGNVNRFTSSIYGTNTGGIVGFINGTLENSFSISSCVNTGTVTGGGINSLSIVDSNTGGILGYARGKLLLSDCMGSGDVTGGTVTEQVPFSSSSTNAAGILGCAYGSVTVTNCLVDSRIVTEKIQGDQITSNAGGILAFSMGGEKTLVNHCVVISPVLTGGEYVHRIVGRVAGILETPDIALENNYAWAGIPGTWSDKGIAGLDGADWSGNMSAEPIKGWDAALWKVDASHEYMPQLDLAGAPLIRNPLSGSIAVEAVRSNSRVYVQGGQLYVDHPESAGRSEVRIYSLSGTLIHQETLLHSPQAIPVPKGIYIVVTGGEAVKVVL